MQKFSFILFMLSCAFIIFICGFIVGEFKPFPYQIYAEAVKGFQKIRDDKSGKLPWYYIRLQKPFPDVASDAGQPYEGLTLVTKMAADKNMSAEIIDLHGRTVHTWDINWFKMWPDVQHLPEADIPLEKPGTHIHGAVLMENGDLVFNFEKKGLIRIDRQGKVVWRLPYITHHTVHRHDDGNLWVCAWKYQTERTARLPNLVPPFYEDMILTVSPQGKILKERSVADILRKNGYAGLLYLGTLHNNSTDVSSALSLRRDILHLNDVEPFPAKFKEGFFIHGDVLVSLRNVNTVFVFNAESEKIKYITTGKFIRQHDPDFLDGNIFSVFDNNNTSALAPDLPFSRIVIVSARENTSRVYFAGSVQNPFFTSIMGKHQWLGNGNLLITESMSGRGFEINQRGQMVWQYVNYVDQGVVGLVDEVQRLPVEYTRIFCNGESSNHHD
jgi:hypothetical protein